MNTYYIVCQYRQQEDSQTTSTLNFYVSSCNINDAWLNAISRVWALFSGSESVVTSITVAEVEPGNEE